MQSQIEVLRELGYPVPNFTLPSPIYIVGLIVFGLIGLFAFYYGKRRHHRATMWLGLALMLYPYVVWNTAMLYVVGIFLTGAAWFYRDS